MTDPQTAPASSTFVASDGDAYELLMGRWSRRLADPFLDFVGPYEELKPELDAAYERFMRSAWYILGKECEAFEQEFAVYCGSKHCIGVGNGLEALHLVVVPAEHLYDLVAFDRFLDHVHQLAHPSLPQQFPPLRSGDAATNNLPVQLTSFIGRDDEVRAVAQLLHDHRVVTLTGSGGAGKTRLALAVGDHRVADGDDGVWLADLSSVVDPLLVPAMLADALGLVEQALQPALDSVASRLTDANLPRMGERFRLRKDFDTSKFSPEVKAILEGLKKYGMLVADNGIDWAISCAPDPRIPVLHDELRKVKGSDFEVVVPPAGYVPAK